MFTWFCETRKLTTISSSAIYFIADSCWACNLNKRLQKKINSIESNGIEFEIGFWNWFRLDKFVWFKLRCVDSISIFPIFPYENGEYKNFPCDKLEYENSKIMWRVENRSGKCCWFFSFFLLFFAHVFLPLFDGPNIYVSSVANICFSSFKLFHFSCRPSFIRWLTHLEHQHITSW